MKRILQILTVALLLPFAGSAQNLLTLSGIVIGGEGLVPNTLLTITTPSTSTSPGVFIDAVWTDENGAFSSVTDLDTPYEVIRIFSDTCGFSEDIVISEYPSTTEFQISCYSDNGGSGGGIEDCAAIFGAATDSIEDGLLYFYNMSEGEDLSYMWSFGDGSPNSTEQFPIHNYADEDAAYEVCLIVSNATCADTLCMVIYGAMDGAPTGNGLVGGGSGASNGHDTQLNSAKSSGFQFIVLDGSTVLSTKEKFNEIDLAIFPNPSSGIVNLKLNLPSTETGVITVTDLTGKVILQEGSITNDNVVLDMTSMPSGIYLVQFRGTESIAVRKIVIQ